ncbi:MAG: hypothetical protein MUF69_08645 [Desulfobacterota bacterium]|nr:hypothetical protein [Thermodesulfobacteriota bacterium]
MSQARDPRHIRGIYNYCDRWCERCPLTSRCLNFSRQSEAGLGPEEMDLHNDRFWQKFSESLQLASELLADLAAQEGIDLNSLEVEEPEADREPVHILIPMSRRYLALVDEWVENLGPELENNPAGFKKPVFLRIVGGPQPADLKTCEESLEVISYYHYFLPPKLARALSGRQEEDAPELVDLPKDSDGSAKIALIAMDRSLGAWGELSRQLPGQQEAIGKMVAWLSRMRSITEKEFPLARAFERPGFDTLGQEE